MRKITQISFFTLVISFLAFSCLNSMAAPTCGVHMPKRNSADLGIEHYSLSSYKLKDADQAKLKGDGLFLCLSYGILDWLVLDLKFGSASIRNDEYQGVKYDYDASWGGGYGFRWQLYKNDTYGIKIIAGLFHLSIHPKANNQDTKRHAILDDSQAELLISKLWGKFDTYVGAKSSTARYIRKFNDTSDTSRIDQNVTLVAGTEYYLNDRWHLNFEGRFFEEEGFTIGARYQF